MTSIHHHAPISSCMVVLDHSQYMLNDDYEPTRFEFQQQAASYIVDCILEEALTMKTRHTTSAVSIPKIGVMAGTDVLIGPQEDTSIVYEALSDNLALSTTDLTTSLRVASLALRKFEKECLEISGGTQEERQVNRKVIIAFVGSPLNDDDDNLDHVGRILKRNATEIIIVALGDDCDETSLQELVSVADGKVVKIASDGAGARETLDGLFGTGNSSQEAPAVLLPSAKDRKDHDTTHRIDALLNRSREERGKIELMLKTSFSSEQVIPPPPPPTAALDDNEPTTTGALLALGSLMDDEEQADDDSDNDDDDDDDLPSPANSEMGLNPLFAAEEKPFDERESPSPLLKALDCGPEIIPPISQQEPTTSTTTSMRPNKPQLTIQTRDHSSSTSDQHESGVMNRELDQIELERHLVSPPLSSGAVGVMAYHHLRQEQENIARFANLRQTHISVAEYERVKTELRAAKRYIRVLQRLVHEKDEMISALHDMIGCLRSQIYDLGTEKSEVTSLTLDDGDSSSESNKEDDDDSSSTCSETSKGGGVGVLKVKNLEVEDDENDVLKPSLSDSSDPHISLEEIRKRTRELEAMHATLTKRSRALERTSLALRRKSSQSLTMTEKRNKKRELEALRASIVSAS